MNLSRKIHRAACFVALLVVVLTFPLPARAAGKSAPPSEPYEKMIFKNGSWETEYIEHEGKRRLIVGYVGSHALPQAPADAGTAEEPPVLKMSLNASQLLKNIHIPLAQAGQNAGTHGSISVMFKDSEGSCYGRFLAQYIEESFATIVPEGEVVLPAGDYEVHIESPVPLVRNEDTGMAPAIFIKGVDYAAWKAYKQKLVQYQQ